MQYDFGIILQYYNEDYIDISAFMRLEEIVQML